MITYTNKLLGLLNVVTSNFTGLSLFSKKYERFLLFRGGFFRQPILTNHVAGLASRRANKVAKWKIGFTTFGSAENADFHHRVPCCIFAKIC